MDRSVAARQSRKVFAITVLDCSTAPVLPGVQTGAELS
jgi:hypothetical protein